MNKIINFIKKHRYYLLFIIIILIITSCVLRTPVTTPIDVVYTWVDGNDKKWLDTRQIYKHNKKTNNDGIVSYRVRELNELKYSLRSIEKYIPWVNNIYIVVDRQKPKWLNLNNPKIHIINHSDIFPDKSHLPTFNSQAIECNLHRIPGLTENFIYFNDDMFLGNHVSKSDLIMADGRHYITSWTNGKCPEGKTNPSELGYTSAWKNNMKLLKKLFGTNCICFCPWHQAQICRKMDFENLEKLAPEEFKITSSSKFRSIDNIAPIGLAAIYSLNNGTSVKTSHNTSIYLNLDKKNRKHEFKNILQKRPQFFCINDANGSSDNIKLFTEFINEYFPHKSTFEI